MCAALLLTGLSGCGGSTGGKTEPKGDPVAITLWHYYSGAQQQIFDQLVDDFNSTVGAEKRVVVEAHSYGSVNDLNEKVLDAIYEKVGAAEVPDVFSTYADTVYEINSLGKVADFSQYLTEEERSAYVSGYLEEGHFEEVGGYKLFPIAKSTELLTLNKTEWDTFAAATGAEEADLATWEGITAIAEQYYTYTDGLTPDVAEDGKAFFGRDAFANYMIIGSKQLGTEIFSVTDGKVTLNVDESIMRRLWDNYYVPYVNGYFNALGKFRSDDVRTGDLIACVGATSAATFFPTEVTRADGSTYAIEVAVYPLPNFEDGDPVAVQQGAGMAIAKSTPEKERAAVEFLKWFTQPAQNLRFATSSGYLPVTYAANQGAAEPQDTATMSTVLKDTLAVGMGMTSDYEFYTSKAFENGYDARKVVDNHLRDKAAADRAAVLELMAAGTPRAEAVAQYNTDENFQAWRKDFHAALESITAN